MALSYFNPWLLMGLAGISIPIIIHLLFKRRKKRVRFSTLRFLRIATRENARRMKIKQWLLLMMRLCIIALIAMAFARPFFRDPMLEASSTGTSEILFVVDVSCSMNGDSGISGSRIDYARDRIFEIMNGLKPSDKVGLIVFDDEPEVLVKLGGDHAAVKSAVSQLSPSFHTTNYISAIDTAQKEFDWESKLMKEMILVSDLQRTGFAEETEFRLNSAVNLRIISVADDVPNFGFSDIETTGSFHQPGRKYPIIGHLQDYGTEGFQNVDVKVRVNSEDVLTTQVSIPPRGSTSITCEHSFLSTGSFGIEFTASSEDGLEQDNTRFMTLDAMNPVRVLCVNGTPSSVQYFRETIYLEAALNPYRLGNDEGDTVYSPQVLGPDEITNLDFGSYSAVILANLRDVPKTVSTRLEDYVRRGGALIWFLGDEVSMPSYNEFLYAKGKGIFPAMLVKEEGDVEDIESFWTISSLAKGHFITDLFRDPTKGDISLARFYKRYDVGGLKEAESETLMSFQDGRPALIEKAMGTGKVLLFTSTVDAAWDDFPKRKTFLPFIHRCLMYVTGNTSSLKAAESYAIGDTIVLDGAASVVETPDGAEVELGETQTLQETELPGVYLVKDSRGNVLKSFAVNLDNAESDLNPFSPDELRTILVGTKKKGGSGGYDDSPLAKKEIWTYLMIGLLALMVGEVWLGNHTPA